MDDIYDIIDSKLSGKYNVDSFLSDFRFIVSTNRGALGFDALKDGDDGKEEDDALECVVDECFVVNRSERDRTTMTQNEQKRKNLFFVSTEMEEDGASRHSVVLQQILDTAHIWHCHTLRVKAEQYIDDKLGDEDHDENDIDCECTDRLIQEFAKLIEQKKKSSNRFRATQSERAKSNGSKFTTMSTEEIQSAIGPETADISGTNTATSFQEEILEEVRGTVLSTGDLKDFYEFIEDEEWDTDALKDDLEDYRESLIMDEFGAKRTKNGKGTKWVLRKWLFEDELRGKLYSAGFRFFYHQKYALIQEEWHTLYFMESVCFVLILHQK